MDGSNVQAGGKVNAQYSAGPYEKFNLLSQSDGTTCITCPTFPGIFLQLDGRGIDHPLSAGGGVVNCANSVGALTKFNIVNVPGYPPGGPYPPINNSGFAFNYATTTTEGPVPPPNRIGDIMRGFATPTQLPVIYQLATEFALCDHWFSSLPGPTWPNRFFVHGASSAGLDHSPTLAEIAAWESVDGFSYPKGSIYQRLTATRMPWRIYNDDTNAYSDNPQAGSPTGKIPQVMALKGISVGVINSLSHFASDLQGDYPYQYTFIEPNYGNVVDNSYRGGSSQHPMDDAYGGEGLIKAVYEAIRNSPVWNSSLLVITYDEHGGFYDSVAPGGATPPNDGSSNTYNKYGFKFDQLGVRVPAVIVSPWIAKGVVDHTIYDHSSVLATLEKIFVLPPLTSRDAAAKNLCGLLQPSLRPNTPTTLNNPAPPPVRPPVAPANLQAEDAEPIPPTGNLHGFLAIGLKTELELSSGEPAERQAIIANFKNIRTKGDARAYMDQVTAKIDAAKALRVP
jgi:phospholipase C